MPDPADDLLRAHIATLEYDPNDCTHDPRCRTKAGHFEREFGIQLEGGPAEQRGKYHEAPAGLLTQDDLWRTADRERRYVSERNRKRRRGWSPDGALLAPVSEGRGGGRQPS